MSIETTIKGELPDFRKLLGDFTESSAKKIRERLIEKLNEQKSGAFYGSHQASAPGESPASDSKALENSIEAPAIAANTLEAIVASHAGHASMLEEGTKDEDGKILIEPRPLWDATADEMLPVLENDLIKAIENYV